MLYLIYRHSWEEFYKMPKLEPMSDFFAARIEGYDEHMINEVEGCKEGYEKIAELIPPQTSTLLDLGCGTGLELDFILAKYPSIKVTGIDLSEVMLAKLKKKHAKNSLNLICGDYFITPIGVSNFNVAVSVESLHHFTAERKLRLYKRIFDSLTDKGIYIECDYMVETQAEEDFFMSENARLRAEQNVPEDAFYHYDTPLTVDTQITLLRSAGFTEIEKHFRIGGTVLLTAKKHNQGNQTL